MFKKLAILTLIATPALAHQTLFNQPEYLRMSGGDPVAAQELAWFCATAGKKGNDCNDVLAGSGNLKQEAARKCVQQARSTSVTFKFPNGFEIPGSLAHQFNGNVWHEDYRKDSDGLHRHIWTKDNRESARQEAIGKQTNIEIQAALGLTGSTVKTSGSGMGGSLQGGTGAISPINVQVTFDINGNKGTEKTLPLLDQAAKDRIKAAGEKAYNDPNNTSIKPSISCMKDEEYCMTGDGSKFKNESYEPKKDKKDDKKGADNTPPPRHEEDLKDADGHVIDHDKTGTWAGNDTPRDADNPMIATSTDVDLNAKSPMEICLDKEFHKLNQEEGSKTKDPNAFTSISERKAQAEALLKSGYCDESFYGYAICQARKIKQDSVVDVTIVAERRDAYKSAMDALKQNGICDAQALGSQFCRDRQTQWNRTPADRLIAPKPTRPGTPIRTLPGN